MSMIRLERALEKRSAGSNLLFLFLAEYLARGRELAGDARALLLEGAVRGRELAALRRAQARPFRRASDFQLFF